MKKRHTTGDIKFEKDIIIEFNEDQLRALEGGASNDAPGTKTTVTEPTTITLTTTSEED